MSLRELRDILSRKGSEKDADQAATEAMRAGFNEMNIDGTIVIGEGERTFKGLIRS